MTLLEQVKHFFDSDEWGYAETEAGLSTAFAGHNGTWDCLARVDESGSSFVFLSIAPEGVPPGRHARAAEFLLRANCGLIIGAFDMDHDLGAAWFRTSTDVEGDPTALTPTVIKHLVYHNVLTMDRYLPGLRSVLEGELEPAEAVRHCEEF